MSQTEKLAAALIWGALLVLLWEPIRSELRPSHPHLQNRQFGCISELFWMETVDRILTDAVEADDEPITIARIKDLAAKGCRDCDQCTEELLEQISRGEDVWGRPLQLRRVPTDDNKVVYEIRSFGKNGRKQDGLFSDDVRILVSP